MGINPAVNVYFFTPQMVICLFPGFPAIFQLNVDIKISVFQSSINISFENEAPRASKSDYVLR